MVLKLFETYLFTSEIIYPCSSDAFFETHNPQLFQLKTGSPQPVPQQKETHDPPKPWPNVTPKIHQYQVTWTSEHSTQRWNSASRLRTIGTYLVLTFSPCARQEDHIEVSWESHTNLRNIHGTIFPINSHRPSGKATTSLPNECTADWSTIVTLEVVLLVILGAAFRCW